MRPAFSRRTQFFDFRMQCGYCIGFTRKDGVWVRYALRTPNVPGSRTEVPITEQRAMYRALIRRIRHRYTLRGRAEWQWLRLRQWVTRVKNRTMAYAEEDADL